MCQSWVFGLIWPLNRLPHLKLPSQKGKPGASIETKATKSLMGVKPSMLKPGVSMVGVPGRTRDRHWGLSPT